MSPKKTDSDEALQAEGARLKALLKADTERALGRIPKAKRPKPSKADDPRTQSEKFAAAAREHGTDQDEEAFKGVLRKLGKASKMR